MGVAHDEDAEGGQRGVTAQVSFAVGRAGVGAVAIQFDVEFLGGA
jgi:hypothetical protein